MDNTLSRAIKDKQNKAKDRHEQNQIMSCKAVSAPSLVRMMHRVVEKSCRRACQLFCCSIENLLCDRLAIWPGQKERGHTEEHHSAAAAATWSPPSTVLIVNISNSTLTDCVIRNETCHPAVAEKQPLMQGTVQDLHGDPNRCTWIPASHSPSIQISSSYLSCVIIGDNNYMQVEQTVPREEETREDCEDGNLYGPEVAYGP